MSLELDIIHARDLGDVYLKLSVVFIAGLTSHVENPKTPEFEREQQFHRVWERATKDLLIIDLFLLLLSVYSLLASPEAKIEGKTYLWLVL